MLFYSPLRDQAVLIITLDLTLRDSCSLDWVTRQCHQLECVLYLLTGLSLKHGGLL